MLVYLHLLIQILVILRVLLRRHRVPASRVAWIVVVLTLPVVGIIACLFLGETNIGVKRDACMRKVMASLPDVNGIPGWGNKQMKPKLNENIASLFGVGKSISGFDPVAGN